MKITPEDVTIAKDELIASLINENLALRAKLQAIVRERIEKAAENGEVRQEA